jgi:DNA-binding NarL/FixJ family response regulator
MQVLLLSRDLLVLSQVQGAAERAGAGLEVAGDGAITAAKCGTRMIDLVVVDLSTPSLQIAELMAAIHQTSPPPRVCAFAPHVQEEKLNAARMAGCDEVVARGQLQAMLDRALSPQAEQDDMGTSR